MGFYCMVPAKSVFGKCTPALVLVLVLALVLVLEDRRKVEREHVDAGEHDVFRPFSKLALTHGSCPERSRPRSPSHRGTGRDQP